MGVHISNRRALHDYEILKTYEAGMQLLGAEVKSIKGGRMTLEGAFVKVIDSELYLVNAQIFPYAYARPEGYDQKRSRKLLLHKKEVSELLAKHQGDRLTIIPLECYTTKSYIKLKIALAKGRKEYEKRDKLKKRDTDRDIERIMKNKG
jgi:SsrA-binding protein